MEDQTKQKLNPFEKLYKKELNSDDLAEMKHNFFGFMDLLLKLDEEQKRNKKELNG